MTSHQLDEESIFHVAREIPDSGARSKYLDQICAGDQALSERVEALLQVDAQDREFLRSRNKTPASTADETPLVERPGKTIGRYRLMEQIGEGGMGVVFVAQQQRPIRRKVALKVIKPGMDSKAVIARFETERQALALMDHPNIAKVLDAGTTEAGRPYFVMDLVRGIPITDYADEKKLTIRERLEIFAQVCQAIQHAHQKAVIHRDIKPTNALVAELDGKPNPKIIDFGVAKALNQSLSDRTVYTSFRSIVGTPLYMSPEQASLSAVDVDTRSDVYSLGALLYELLTGCTLFDKAELGKAGDEAVLRIIREKEPQKPSTKIATLGADRATGVSQTRHTDPGTLCKSVRGDLDCIVMKAIDKDRARRYETASALAADVQRYLDGEAIEARPPSARYRLSKFVWRNRSSVAAGILMGLTLVAATVVSTLGWTKALRLQSKLKQALIYRAAVDAMAGNIESAFTSIDDIGDRSAEKWKTILQALNDVHNGNAKAAIEPMRALFDREPDNVVAGSLLAAAYERSYQANRKEKTIMQLRGLKTEDPLEVLLYQSVQSVFFAPRSAAEQIEKLVYEHNWELARVLLAKAIYFRAIDTDNWEDAAKAADLAQDSKKRLPPLQTTYSVELLANLTAHHLAPPAVAKTETWLEDADAAAAILENQFYDSSLPELAVYYFVRHDTPERSLEILKQSSASSGIEGAVTGLQMLTGDYGPVNDSFLFNPYVALDTEQDLGKAADIIREEIGTFEGVSVRTVWYRPPLCACGEQERAETIKVWEQMLDESDSLLWNLEYALNLLSGRWDLQRGLSEAGHSRIKQSLVHFAVGTRALYIEDDREKAKREFETCEGFKFFNVDYYYLTRAYLKRLQDPNWPNWIPREES